MSKGAWSAIAVGLFIAMGASSAQAQEAGGYDGKSYSGAFCQPYGSAIAYVTSPFGYYASAAGGNQIVTCPAVKDNWSVASGLSYAYVRLYQPAGQTTNCTIFSINYSGTTISSTTVVSTTAGEQTLYLSPYPPTNAGEGAYSIMCSIPTGAYIRRYVLQEKP
jgi:hypothetical protein